MYEVNRLNSDYAKMVDVAMNMESIYHCMVAKENYRMLAHFQYNHDETPIRSARLAGPPPMTDVINFYIFYIYNNFIFYYILLSHTG